MRLRVTHGTWGGGVHDSCKYIHHICMQTPLLPSQTCQYSPLARMLVFRGFALGGAVDPCLDVVLGSFLTPPCPSPLLPAAPAPAPPDDLGGAFRVFLAMGSRVLDWGPLGLALGSLFSLGGVQRGGTAPISGIDQVFIKTHTEITYRKRISTCRV